SARCGPRPDTVVGRRVHSSQATRARATADPMRPWTIDADDIQIADDFDAALLHKTVWIENFLDANRDDQIIVVGTKSFGKTLLLKAKSIRCQQLGDLCLPQDALLDNPVGNKKFSRELLGIYEADIEPWSRVWIT